MRFQMRDDCVPDSIAEALSDPPGLDRPCVVIIAETAKEAASVALEMGLYSNQIPWCMSADAEHPDCKLGEVAFWLPLVCNGLHLPDKPEDKGAQP